MMSVATEPRVTDAADPLAQKYWLLWDAFTDLAGAAERDASDENAAVLAVAARGYTTLLALARGAGQPLGDQVEVASTELLYVDPDWFFDRCDDGSWRCRFDRLIIVDDTLVYGNEIARLLNLLVLEAQRREVAITTRFEILVAAFSCEGCLDHADKTCRRQQLTEQELHRRVFDPSREDLALEGLEGQVSLVADFAPTRFCGEDLFEFVRAGDQIITDASLFNDSAFPVLEPLLISHTDAAEIKESGIWSSGIDARVGDWFASPVREDSERTWSAVFALAEPTLDEWVRREFHPNQTSDLVRFAAVLVRLKTSSPSVVEMSCVPIFRFNNIAADDLKRMNAPRLTDYVSPVETPGACDQRTLTGLVRIREREFAARLVSAFVEFLPPRMRFLLRQGLANFVEDAEPARAHGHSVSGCLKLEPSASAALDEPIAVSDTVERPPHLISRILVGSAYLRSQRLNAAALKPDRVVLGKWRRPTDSADALSLAATLASAFEFRMSSILSFRKETIGDELQDEVRSGETHRTTFGATAVFAHLASSGISKPRIIQVLRLTDAAFRQSIDAEQQIVDANFARTLWEAVAAERADDAADANQRFEQLLEAALTDRERSSLSDYYEYAQWLESAQIDASRDLATQLWALSQVDARAAEDLEKLRHDLEAVVRDIRSAGTSLGECELLVEAAIEARRALRVVTLLAQHAKYGTALSAELHDAYRELNEATRTRSRLLFRVPASLFSDSAQTFALIDDLDADVAADARKRIETGSIVAFRDLGSGRDAVPLWAMSADGRRIDALVSAFVLKHQLNRFNPRQLELWLHRPTTFLEGRRPIDVVKTDPASAKFDAFVEDALKFAA